MFSKIVLFIAMLPMLIMPTIASQFIIRCRQDIIDYTHYICGSGKITITQEGQVMYPPVAHPIYTALYNVYPDTMTPHRGVDIIGDAQILAAQAGVVVDACQVTCTGDYGRYVIISHAEEVFTLYGHMEQVFVSIGERVERMNMLEGTVLGIMGNTGLSFGVHVHFEVRNAIGDAYNNRMDPLNFIEVYVQNCSNMFGVVDALMDKEGGYRTWYSLDASGRILVI